MCLQSLGGLSFDNPVVHRAVARTLVSLATVDTQR